MTISFLNLSESPKIRDSDWLANCFMLARDRMHPGAYKAMMYSSADWKFTDTRIGGNIAINMPPAYTRFADPRASGLNEKNGSSDGMRVAGLGEYWADQIDEHAQIIHIQFGVPAYRGMLSFFSGASNIEAGLLARTGRVSASFFVGKVVGFVVGLRLLPFILAGTVIKFLVNRTGSRYYNLKPAMHPYWNRVNFIANMLAVSEGLVDRYASNREEGRKYDPNLKYNIDFDKGLESAGTALEPSDTIATQKLAQQAHSACPELFLESGGMDIYRVASRYQELANQRRKFLEKLGEQRDAEKLLRNLIDYSYNNSYSADQRNIDELHGIYDTDYGHPQKFDGVDAFSQEAQQAATTAMQGAISGGVVEPTDGQAQAIEGSTDQTTASESGASSEGAAQADKNYITMTGTWTDSGETGTDPEKDIKRKEGWFESWWKGLSQQAKAGYDGAFGWVAFKVNATGSVSASFSNSTTTPEIKTMINSFSSSAAKLRFNFSQGATGIKGLDTVMGSLKEAVLGFADGVSLMGLVSLAGSSFIDIPDTWEDSSASLPTESYEMHLRTPYGNALSRMMNLHIPTAMWLAGALPISTGRQTYASPFICKLISVGRSNMDLAMIDSLNITHGVGNLGFTKDGKPLQVNISASFKDLNRSVHAPIDTGGSLLNPLNALSIFDDDNNFNYYINTLAGVSVADQVIAVRRLERNARLKMLNYSSFFSTGHLTLALTESAPGRTLRSAMSAGALLGGPFEALAPGMNRIT